MNNSELQQVNETQPTINTSNINLPNIQSETKTE